MKFSTLSLCIFFAIFSLTSCKKSTSPTTTQYSTITYASYDEDWKEVEKMEKKGLAKMIIAKLDTILQKALNEQNTPQIFKVLAYRSKYYHQIAEDSDLKIFNQFENQLKQSSFPLKQLLHSALAELYHGYYQQNRWKFQDRTSTSNFELHDLRSWSLTDILYKIDEHYQASLIPKNDLLTYPIQNFESILHLPTIKNGNWQLDGTSLQPSLYDFLAHRALDYYKLNEGRISIPQNEFDPYDFPVFSTINEFLQLNFNHQDSTSNTLKTALLFQELLAGKVDTDNEAALIYLNLMRLRHYYTNSDKTDKEKIYIEALNKFSAQYATSKNRAEIEYEIAKVYSELGSSTAHQKIDSSYRGYLKKAVLICRTYSNQNSYGGKLCHILLEKLEQKSIQVQTETVYLPNEVIEYLVVSRNSDSIFHRLIKIPHHIESQYAHRQNSKDYLRYLNQQTPVQQWVQKINHPGDFNHHSYSFSINGLTLGNYILVSSTSPIIVDENSNTNINNFIISQLSTINFTDTKEQETNFYALNRKSGLPIPKAQAILYTSEYDYSNRDYKTRMITKLTSNDAGFFKRNFYKRENYHLMLVHQTDTLTSEQNYYTHYQNNRKSTTVRTHLFTDRAIYRPGQIVYFKGIVIEEGNNNHQVKSNYTTTVVLRNKNYEEVAKLRLVTNDYGSFEGNFVLPGSGLNGRFHLIEKNGNSSFLVEEYKRPTFEIKLDTAIALKKINKNISIDGQVAAYNGAKISDATVNYRIIRSTNFPYWGYWRGSFPNFPTKEIGNGRVITDENGQFKIDFFAAAEEGLSSQWNPTYNFEVTIDVTSLSGETQTLSESINIGTQNFYFSTNIENQISQDAIEDLIIFAKNIDGQLYNTKAKLEIYQLEVPNNFEVEKYWNSTEYDNNQMVDEHSSTTLQHYKKDKKLLSGQVMTNKNTSLVGKLPAGAYQLEVTAEGISFQHRFVVFNKNARQPTIPSFSTFYPLTTSGEPGDSASFIIGSSLKNVSLLYTISANGQLVSSKWINLQKEQKKIYIPIQERYRGNFEVNLIGIHSNRMIHYSMLVTVPFTNKELNIELGTHRDKVQPGSKEKWTMKIKGSKGDLVAAELLAGMYDQSLDQFVKDDWNLNLYQSANSGFQWKSDGTFGKTYSTHYGNEQNISEMPQRYFPQLNWFGFNMVQFNPYNRSSGLYLAKGVETEIVENEAVMNESSPIRTDDLSDQGGDIQEKSSQNQLEDADVDDSKKTPANNNLLRTDFRETAFFYPQLKTDKNGTVTFEFDLPDALTRWKFRAIAHTKDLKVGKTETSIVTQKELMVVPNFPRFFREGDELNLLVLVNNLNTEVLDGIATIRFYNAFTNEPITIAADNGADQKFSILPKASSTVNFNVIIPSGIQAIKYIVKASAAKFSDGEEKVIPVLSNRMLITETLPLSIRGNQTKHFTFERLLNNSSSTLKNHSYSLEFTSNPAWYAIQALPYITEVESDCAEKVFAKLYANLLAEKIANSHPMIQDIVKLWGAIDSEELSSKLMQNQELKTILIEETPWLKQAKSESEQKKRIALLFDLNKMANEKTSAIAKLRQLQLPNGGWSWYKGMTDSRYITQYIINGFGHLQQLGVEVRAIPEVDEIIHQGLLYLDNRLEEDYEKLKKTSTNLNSNNLNALQIHHLYTRSFFLDVPFQGSKNGFNYYLNQAEEHWLDQTLQLKGMIALAVYRLQKNSNLPPNIITAIKDNAIQSEELGMYWKENQSGYYWYHSAIETQALLMELFQEVGQNNAAVDEMRIWLLKHKQTNSWSNSKATAVACYALLYDNVAALATQNSVTIKLDKQIINPFKEEAGTGYFKEVWNKGEIQPELGKITVSKSTDGIAWGAAYWQYYEDLDKITTASVNELSIQKDLFKIVITDRGVNMLPVDLNSIKVGDKIRVRLKIESKRNLEFIHLKDMRAAGFEPINVLSRFKYQDGLGYYESTKDASTNFFIDYLQKGVYVFEYDLRATISGEFSNGISIIQCQYAPEFAAHSKGKRISILN